MSEKRRGRPTLYDEPMVQVGTRLPASVHDRLMALSLERETPVHQVVREAITRLVAEPRDRR